MSESSSRTDENILLEILVDEEFIEIVSDALWSCGAQAVEVLEGDLTPIVRTHLGVDPVSQWKAHTEQYGTEANKLHVWPVRLYVQQADVANTWRQFATTTVVETIALIPQWKRDQFDHSNPSLLPVFIEPYGSFGMGDHPTTQATLNLAFDNLKMTGDFPHILDIGCGSGVLSVALLKKLGGSAHGIDLAATAIEASNFNAQLNGVEELFTCQQGGLECITGTYLHVLANILAPVLLEGSVIIGDAVHENGYLFLSGFTTTRESDIISCYEKIGFRYIARREIDGWVAVSLQRVNEHLLAQ